jgi:hypothetical protein
MNRAERRLAERAQRKVAEDKGWPLTWMERPNPKAMGVGRGGWLGDMDRAFSDDEYAVMIRTVVTPWGQVDHVCIRNRASTDIPWAEKQRIKNEIFGPERVAIEVFPAESELADAANMYHIWVLPAGTRLPFGLDGDLPRARHPD